MICRRFHYRRQQTFFCTSFESKLQCLSWASQLYQKASFFFRYSKSCNQDYQAAFTWSKTHWFWWQQSHWAHHLEHPDCTLPKFIGQIWAFNLKYVSQYWHCYRHRLHSLHSTETYRRLHLGRTSHSVWPMWEPLAHQKTVLLYLTLTDLHNLRLEPLKSDWH